MFKKIVIANWKMNPASRKEAEKLFSAVAGIATKMKKTKIIICAPFVYLVGLKKLSLGHSHTGEARKAALGGQNIFWEESGAFTGEISGEMLYDTGARYVILGHSERRGLLTGTEETNAEVARKVKSALSSGLCPIVCVGEVGRDENHEYLSFIRAELEESLAGVSKNSLGKIIIAYEPIWAIGHGTSPATPEEFREMNLFLRKILSDKFGVRPAGEAKIIYGGSVNEKNAGDFLQIGQADGFLVGRASLSPKKFGKIIEICEASGK